MSKITWIKDDVLGFGDIDTCALAGNEDRAVVHACKFPCHRSVVGYQNQICKDHPCYLAVEKDGDLYLNIIDPPLPLFQPKSFEIFFDFVDRHLHKKPLVIHCNKGESRAPSLALLVMAKRMFNLPCNSYADARAEFEKRYNYNPGKGISRFLEENWEVLGDAQAPPASVVP